MANRLMAGRAYSHERERKVVNARVYFGAAGAPTLDGLSSIGVLSVTRQSTGLFTFQFGYSGGQGNVVEGYVKVLGVETLPDVSYIAGAAPAAVGQPALYRNDLDTGLSIAAPVQAAVVAVGGGGTFAAASYFWKVTAIDSAYNETLASNEQTQAIALNGSATISWAAVPGAVAYRVYRGTASGAENVVYLVPGGATVSFTDINAATQATPASTPPNGNYGVGVQARPPIAKASVTLQLLSGAGAATDPANGEALYVQFDFGDYTGA